MNFSALREQVLGALTASVSPLLLSLNKGGDKTCKETMVEVLWECACVIWTAFYLRRVAKALVQEAHRDVPDNLESAPSLSGY